MAQLAGWLGFRNADFSGICAHSRHSGKGGALMMAPSPNSPTPARPKRFALELPIEYRPQNDDRWWPGKTENISANGVLFTAKKGVPPATPIEVLMQLPPELTGDSAVRLLCLGHVVRSEESPTASGEAQMAATFVDFRLANGKAGPSGELRQAQLVAARGEIATLAHRLNTLLCIIMGNAELLLLDPKDEAKVRSLSLQTRHATEEAAAIVGSLATMLRPGSAG